MDLESVEPCIVGDLIKLYLAELPEPLFTCQHFPKLSKRGIEATATPSGLFNSFYILNCHRARCI